MGYRTKEKNLQSLVPSIKRITKRFYPYIKSRQLLILGSFLILLLEAGFRLLEPWPIKFVFDHVLLVKNPQNHLIFGFNYSIDPTLLLLILTCTMVTISVLGSFAAYLSTFGMALASVQILTDIRRDLFSHLQRLSLSFHLKHKTGDLLTRVTEDIDRIKLTLVKVVLPLVTNLISLVGMLIIMTWMNWELAALALIICPVFLFFISRLVAQIRSVTQEHRQLQGLLASTTSETIGAIKVVQALALNDQFEAIFRQQNEKTLDQSTKSLKLSALLQRTVQVLIALTVALVLWRGSHLVIEKTLTPGDLLVFITYLKNAFEPLRKLSNQLGDIAKSTASAERIMYILDYEPHVINLPHACNAHPFRGAVRLEKVTFGYNGDRPILDNLSFTIQPGQKIGLVGRSGSGKSTLMSLLLRLYDPNSGRILIDDCDIRDYTLASLRQQISVVLQDSILFAATLRENIAYGKIGASDAEIAKAARLANAHDFIMQLPEGYDTVVGERGCTLSGGQRQRIAIARAAVRQAPIIILDEPTTGLDKASEIEVLEAIEQLSANKTTFLISHDLKAVKNADVIFYLENGQIVEQGTHPQLMAKSGYYAALYQLQDVVNPHQGVSSYAF